MEKRYFLALLLSFAVLFTWQALFGQKPKTDPLSSESQITQNKEITSLKESTKELGINTSSPMAVATTVEAEPLASSSDEKITVLDTDTLSISFSSVGGVIKDAFIKEYDFQMPTSNFGNIDLYASIPMVIDQVGARSIQYRYEDDNIIVIRKYTLQENDYIVQSNTSITNKSAAPISPVLTTSAYKLDMSNLNGKSDAGLANASASRDKSLFEYIIHTDEDVRRKSNAFKFDEKKDSDTELSKVNWVGFRSRYYCAIIRPLFDTVSYSLNPTSKSSLDIKYAPVSTIIQPGSVQSYDSVIYIGPERIERLKEYGFGFEEIRMYYRLGIFNICAKAIYWLIHFMQGFIPNWGLCIILASIIIYFGTYPLTAKSMSSMKKMQSLQPHLSTIKEKHASNPQKMNQEMMELYKTHKVNPFGGCLPILFQMPVFIGLYQALWRDVSFKGAGFLWIKDLTEPDRLFIMPFSLPFFGNEVNLLPLLMVVIMYFQQKISAKNMNVTDPMQKQQQKMMGTIMPVFLGFIFYKFASGLSLYFVMFYCFSTLTQWKMAKTPAA